MELCGAKGAAVARGSSNWCATSSPLVPICSHGEEVSGPSQVVKQVAENWTFSFLSPILPDG